MLGWARRLLADELNLRQELDLAKLELRGRLRVGVIPSAIALVPALTSGVLALHPLVEVEAMEMSSAELLRKLALYELDAGITYVDNELLERVRVRPIAAEELVLAVPADSPSANRAAVSWREAALLPLCLLDAEMQNRRIIDAAFESVGTKPNVKIETNSIMSTIFHVRAGTLSTIVARSFAEAIAPLPGIHFAALVEPEIRKSVGLVVASRDPVPALVGAIWAVGEAGGLTQQPIG